MLAGVVVAESARYHYVLINYLGTYLPHSFGGGAIVQSQIEF